MTVIREKDFIQSIADGFQFISYYHPADYIAALAEAYEREESDAARDAMAQILLNSRMSAEGARPICQDTGIAGPVDCNRCDRDPWRHLDDGQQRIQPFKGAFDRHPDDRQRSHSCNHARQMGGHACTGNDHLNAPAFG